MNTLPSFTSLEILLFSLFVIMLIVNFILTYQFRIMRKVAKELGELVGKKEYTITELRKQLKEYFDRDNKRKRDYTNGRFAKKN